ncbi:MAG: UvrB/UvrC motif-containing protein [Planctomycetes bacterium]|nr:UvrB/UvrC motif-containing protein [Planctomycetota bacterium]
MNQNKLKDKIKRFPKTSGVYFMKNAAGKIIYIGKANNLHSRVASYFHGVLDVKTRSLMQEVKDITYRKTTSDLDALLLEARLVRERKPKYNIQLTDDKSFPLLAVTGEEFPRVFVTRERGKKNIAYYGPFISSTDLRKAFRTLQRIFRFRVCKHKIGNGKSCLLAHINLCLAPCLGKINQNYYHETIISLEGFLKGDKVSLNKRLKRLMKEASQSLDYENAAFCRDQIKALDNISETGKLGPFYEEAFLVETPLQKLQSLKETLGLAAEPVRIEGVDISDIKGMQAVGSVVVFIDGEPDKNFYRRFKIKQTTEGMADDYSRIREIVRRRFYGLSKENVNVDMLLIDGGKGHVNAAAGVFVFLDIAPPVIIGLTKGKKRETVYLLKQGVISKLRMNNKLRLLGYVRDEAHRFAQKYHHLRRSKEALK